MIARQSLKTYVKITKKSSSEKTDGETWHIREAYWNSRRSVYSIGPRSKSLHRETDKKAHFVQTESFQLSTVSSRTKRPVEPVTALTCNEIDWKKNGKLTYYNHKTGHFNEKDTNSQKALSVAETAGNEHKEKYIFWSVLGLNRSFVSCDKTESSAELFWWGSSFDWLSWNLNPRIVENFCALYFQPAEMLAFFAVQSSHQKNSWKEVQCCKKLQHWSLSWNPGTHCAFKFLANFVECFSISFF